MKVKLAAQVLSSSVADALQFMMDSKVPGFHVSSVKEYFPHVIEKKNIYLTISLFFRMQRAQLPSSGTSIVCLT